MRVPHARAGGLYPADEVDDGADQHEVQSRAGSDVAVADVVVMQGYSGAQLGVRAGKTAQPVESPLGGVNRGGTTGGRCWTVNERDHGVAHEFEDFAAAIDDRLYPRLDEKWGSGHGKYLGQPCQRVQCNTGRMNMHSYLAPGKVRVSFVP